ncbi:hypothetical protein D6C77_03335 [Aureobasidium pullulans]|nr:hypothetical protein D6D04_07948 [Aureobasidium pullulans]TIA58629.1 hypothetical protein D6C76_10587 [Aureobasidium pullulans]TIA61636.1 hypothetical protein D6C77_03335 [Aureobasidium pullulans]
MLSNTSLIIIGCLVIGNMSAAAGKNDTGLEAVEKRALFTLIYLVHLDQSRHDLYAIYHGFPAGVDMPSHLKLPSISGSDRDTKIEQQVTKLLFEERDKLWHAKLGEDVTVVAEIRATVRGPGTGNDLMSADEYQIPVYDVSSIDLSITTREEFERRLDLYWWRVRTSYTAYRKSSDEEKKKFRVDMTTAAISMRGK